MKQICENCLSTEVARCKWVNVNNDKIYNADSGTTLEWCMNCNEETSIIDAEDVIMWQPEFKDGFVVGHEDEGEMPIASFDVYKTKEELLVDFPNTTPLSYKVGEIEDPRFLD